MSTNGTAKQLETMVEQVISSFPPGMRGKSVATQLRNYVAALAVQPGEGEPRVPETVPRSELRPPRVPQALRPIDPSGRLPRIPADRRKARERAGFTLPEVATAARTTVTTAMNYEADRARIRRNDKRAALDEIYAMFAEAT